MEGDGSTGGATRNVNLDTVAALLAAIFPPAASSASPVDMDAFSAASPVSCRADVVVMSTSSLSTVQAVTLGLSALADELQLARSDSAFAVEPGAAVGAAESCACRLVDCCVRRTSTPWFVE